MFPYLTVLQTHYLLNVSTCLFDLIVVTHPATHLINLLILESNLLKPIILPLYQKLPNAPPLSRLMFCTRKQQFSHFSAVSYILLHLYVFVFILVSHVTHREHFLYKDTIIWRSTQSMIKSLLKCFCNLWLAPTQQQTHQKSLQDFQNNTVMVL